jgi:hypothetical protein
MTDALAGIRRSPLAIGLAALFALPLSPAVAGDGGQTLIVTSCADDGSEGTLRSVLALASWHDTVDLTKLQCSRITLAQGELVSNASIRIEGSGRDRLAIDAGGKSRVFNTPGEVVFSGLTITGGHVEADIAAGGCILGFSGITLIDSDVTECSVRGARFAAGGAIETQYVVSLTSSTVSASSAISEGYNAAGGGIAVYYGFLVARTSSISGNSASGSGGRSRGGGFFAERGMNLIRSTIEGNTADLGGGFYRDNGPFDYGDATINDSTVSGNVATVSGGGGYFHAQKALEILGSTIASNQALTGDGGGILFVSDDTGGFSSHTVDLGSSIVANNVAPLSLLAPDIDAPPGDPVKTTGDDDLLTTTGRIVPDSWVTGDPMLAPLDDNGGPTRTHALLAGSAAIDGGADVTGLDVDQRGRQRAAGVAADIGAFETQPDAMFADGFEGVD